MPDAESKNQQPPEASLRNPAFTKKGGFEKLKSFKENNAQPVSKEGVERIRTNFGDQAAEEYGQFTGLSENGHQESEESPEETDENAMQENINLARLNQARALNVVSQDIRNLEKNIQTYGMPSKAKYGFLFGLALSSDAIDWLELTGVGYFVAKAYKTVVWVILFLTMGPLSRNKSKEMHEYATGMQDFIKDFQARVAHYSRLNMKASRYATKYGRRLRNIPGLKGLGRGLEKGGRAIPRALVRVRRAARKNPFFKWLTTVVAEYIPVLDLVPGTSVLVILSYLDEKSAAEEAQEASQAAIMAKNQEAQIIFEEAA